MTDSETAKRNSDITLFAKTNFRGKEVPFGIKTDDRRRHMYIIGKTGMGKSTLMENMVIQDIANGKGVALVDPHGDLVEKILNYIPAKRVNDVVYINPADMEYPIAFNILESVDPRYKHLVASGLMGVFTKIWAGVWSARMEYILNNCILALLDSPGNTLLGITRMLVDKKFRKKIVDSVKDPLVRAFWIDEFANWQEKYRQESISPILNKVGQFLSSGVVRNIVGQPKSTIDLRQLMDDKKILMLNLSKGRVGEDNSRLLGAMLITKLQLAALSRVDIPEEQRNDFYLYVDEFQNFATDSFATILSEARKYRLNLIIAHQYIGQLIEDRNNTKVRDAVFGNVGTMITFRVGAADAEYLEQEFEPQFMQTDLVNLPKYTVVLRLMINGVASDPFSAVTLSPEDNIFTDNAEKVIRISRERYANHISGVEEKITRWMGQDDVHEQVAIIAAGAKLENRDDDEEEEEASTAQEPKALPKPDIDMESRRPLAEPLQAPKRAAQSLAVEAELPEEQEFEAKLENENLAAERDIEEEVAEQPARQAPREVLQTPMEEPVRRVNPGPVFRPKPVESGDRQQNRAAQPQQQRQQGQSGHNQQPRRPGDQQRPPQQERRSRDEGHNPDRRKKKQQPQKHSNPIWDQVDKMTQQKITDDHNKTKAIVNDLSKEPRQQDSRPAQQTGNNQPLAAPRREDHAPHESRNNGKVVLKPGESRKF